MPGRATAPDQVLEAIRSRILSGQLGPGSTLRQEQLAEDLGVSRMPVREALKRLEAEGLIDVLPNRRVRVAPLGREEVQELYELRSALEPLAVRLAVPRLSAQDLRDLARALEDADDEADVATFGERNTRFHLTLIAPCGRPRMLALITSLLELSDRYQRAALHHEQHTAQVREEHRRIFAAAESGDAEAAARAAEEHVRCAGQRVMGLFGETQ